jgi:ATP-dependent DNA helicase PIF1
MEKKIGEYYVCLLDDIVIGHTDSEEETNRLIKDVFLLLHANTRSGDYVSTRAVLSTKNEHVDELNVKMIDKFPGEEKVYHNFESIEDDL